MCARKSIKLTPSNTKKLSILFEVVSSRPFLLRTVPTSENQLVNVLLEDLLSVLLDKWLDKGSKVKYTTLLNKMIAQRSNSESQAFRHIIKKQDELLYLLMSTNQAILRQDKDDFKKIKSMYKYGTKENEIYAALDNLVNRDNRNYFETD
ncbi:hypothetical protein [Limosilactobacillus antri]|uniref:hypothetical protein n=1 Tax=Limosilactobacillus antri TaxID=227943 RepID=UPI001F5A0B92|nr:hypothetical protein [Limosilactobacillus antri]